MSVTLITMGYGNWRIPSNGRNRDGSQKPMTLPSEGKGRTFESCRVRQSFQIVNGNWECAKRTSPHHIPTQVAINRPQANPLRRSPVAEYFRFAISLANSSSEGNGQARDQGGMLQCICLVSTKNPKSRLLHKLYLVIAEFKALTVGQVMLIEPLDLA